MIRTASCEKNSKLYPSYAQVLLAKQSCYPDKTDITIAESKAEVKLQALLNHSAQRILNVQKDVIKIDLQTRLMI